MNDYYWVNDVRKDPSLQETKVGQQARNHIDLGNFSPTSCDNGNTLNYAGTFVSLHISIPPQKEKMLDLIKIKASGGHACCIEGKTFSDSFMADENTSYFCQRREDNKHPGPKVNGLKSEDIRKSFVKGVGVCYGKGHAKEWATFLFKLVQTIIPESSSQLSEEKVRELKDACAWLFGACMDRANNTGESGNPPPFHGLSLEMHHLIAPKFSGSDLKLNGVEAIAFPATCKGMSCKHCVVHG
jgi:hypothetical protein